MASTPYCPPVPSPPDFIHPILLQSLLLDFSCVTPAMTIGPECLCFNVHCVFLQLVEELLNECRNEEVACCQNCEQALWRTKGWATCKMQSVQTFLYIVVTPPSSQMLANLACT